MRIVIIDDSGLRATVLEEGLREAGYDDIHIVPPRGAFVARLERMAPDVVLMDIRMPVLDGIGATAEILADPAHAEPAYASGAPRVVMLTTFDLDEAAARAIRGGASGFLLKDADPEFLLAAIRTVHAGSAVIAATATRELFAHFAQAPRPAPPAYGDLTEREREVLLLVARGRSNQDIADELFISPHTAKTHVNRIMTKLYAHDRAQLVIIAYESGLLAPGA